MQETCWTTFSHMQQPVEPRVHPMQKRHSPNSKKENGRETCRTNSSKRSSTFRTTFLHTPRPWPSGESPNAASPTPSAALPLHASARAGHSLRCRAKRRQIPTGSRWCLASLSPRPARGAQRPGACTWHALPHLIKLKIWEQNLKNEQRSTCLITQQDRHWEKLKKEDNILKNEKDKRNEEWKIN
jgi:hypothetical protein